MIMVKKEKCRADRMQNLNDKLREMKKITILLSMILLAFSMSLISCNNDLGELDNPTADVNTPKKDPNFKSIIVMSDIHVMAPQLLENRGTAYEKYLSQDPKLLEYSGEVLENLVEEALRRNPDLVIIPGDLTKDGELVSHQLVVSILGRLRSADIPVIVVPGNHDIDNPKGYYFDGDNTRPAERTSTEQFKTATTRHTQKTLPRCRSSVNRLKDWCCCASTPISMKTTSTWKGATRKTTTRRQAASVRLR